jgi:hypothetical protein
MLMKMDTVGVLLAEILITGNAWITGISLNVNTWLYVGMRLTAMHNVGNVTGLVRVKM